MTAIGKIFVIINLLFSLVVAGFIVVLFAKSTNWADAYGKLDKVRLAAEASRTSLQTELEQERVARDTRLGDKDKEIETLKGQVTAAKAESAQRQTDLDNLRKGTNA